MDEYSLMIVLDRKIYELLLLKYDTFKHCFDGMNFNLIMWILISVLKGDFRHSMLEKLVVCSHAWCQYVRQYTA
jgi:hypothetical protein